MPQIVSTCGDTVPMQFGWKIMAPACGPWPNHAAIVRGCRVRRIN